jgi:hypothetical protein
MNHQLAVASPANDNRDLYETPEGAYFQILKARRRHLTHDTAAMTAERYREWRSVLAGLDETERVILAWLREGRSAAAARRRPGVGVPLAGLRLLAVWLLAGRFRN